MNSLRILVIEDEAMIAMLLSDVLSGLGHVVTDIAATETEAVTAAAKTRPDLMIVDASLGEGNGTGASAVDAILASGFVPHIFVTGDPRSMEASRPGAIVMQKPFFEHELVEAIVRALARTEWKPPMKTGRVSR